MSGMVDLGFEPREHQREVHAMKQLVRFLVIVWHRRAGKTIFAIMELILGALVTTNGRFAYLSPLLKQSKSVAWDPLKFYARRVPGMTLNESELWVQFPNGARITLYGADHPDSLRGLGFDGIVADEVAQMKPDTWGQVVRPALTDRLGWAIFIGTPKGVNLFSELYFSAVRGMDGWGHDLRRARDTGVIPDEELAAAKTSMSPNEYAQEFECDFAAAVENAILPLPLVLAAQERKVGRFDYIDYPRVLGADVARIGGDRNVIFPRQGPVAMPPTVYRLAVDTKYPAMVVADKIMEAIDSWKAHYCFVDIGGLGAPILDRINQSGYGAIGVDFGSRAINHTRFENRRAEMWWKMAEWVRSVGSLPNIQALTQDLTGPLYSFANARDRFSLESKDDLRKRGLPSPDLGDGLALTFAQETPPVDMFAIDLTHRMKGQMGSRKIQTEDDFPVRRLE